MSALLERFTDGSTAFVGRTLAWLLHDSPTNDGIHGTRWGAYQAVTEYLDHYIPVKAKDHDSARATRVVTGEYDQIKRDAFARLAAA